MYRDLRVRNSNRPTPVPRSYHAFTFMWGHGIAPVYKTIVAPSYIIAEQRIRDFSRENDIDVFWQFICEDDFEVAHSNDVIPKY